jgi:hypothetical protein
MVKIKGRVDSFFDNDHGLIKGPERIKTPVGY